MRRLIFAALATLWTSLAFAQSNNTTTWTTPGNQYVSGLVQMCLNASSQAVPCSTPGSGSAGYPPGATPIGASFSGADTTTASATLAAAAGKFTYVCTFTISGLGATAATTVNATVATLAGSVTLTYSYVFQTGAAVVDTSVSATYSPCIPANAVNTGITVTVPGAAGNTATQINVSGYQQ